MINSLRPIVSGCTLFGKPGTALSFGRKVSTAHDRDWAWNLSLERYRCKLDPHFPRPSAAYAWSEPIDRTKDGLPFFGRLPGHPDTLYATSFSGDGVGPCRLAGKVIAAMALNQHNEWANLGFVRTPM